MSGLAGTTTTRRTRTRARPTARSLRRTAALAAVLAGVVIAAVPFVFGLAGNVNGGERVTDRFRAAMTTDGLRLLDVNFKKSTDMSAQFFGETLPDVRRALHETPAQFDARLRRDYPAITEAGETVPPVVALVKPRIPFLVSLDDDFSEVDSLPFLGLPISSVPWILLGLGVGVAGLGAFVLARPSRAGVALIAAAGLGLAAVPLAMDAPGKADAAVNLDRAGQFVMDPKVAPLALKTTYRVDALVQEVRHKFIPQLAATRHESAAAVTRQLVHRYPAVGRGLAAWPQIRQQATYLPKQQIASETDFANLHGIPFRALPWTVIGPGIAVLLVALAALALGRREREGQVGST
jgi:hypothetical protein